MGHYSLRLSFKSFLDNIFRVCAMFTHNAQVLYLLWSQLDIEDSATLEIRLIDVMNCDMISRLVGRHGVDTETVHPSYSVCL